ncbi:toll/interleukin-1 receptor domain-containing protein [Embleya sp. NPDC055664]
MPDIFVNYRTGDEEATAALVDHELSRRFGSERVFRAGKSIEPGRRFPQALITALRRSSVLLAVIGSGWMEARAAQGGRALDDPEDWTRREIIEALESGSLVIPVLVGRAVRLERELLPPALADLADHQYRRLDHRNIEVGLAQLGNNLAELVPQLAAADRDRCRDGEARGDTDMAVEKEYFRGVQTRAHDVRHTQRGGIGNLVGDLSGTFISEPQAPVHTGTGDQYNAPRFSGDNTGLNYTAGDSSGTIRQRFDGRHGGSDKSR